MPAAGDGLRDGRELPIDRPTELGHLAAQAFEQQAAPLLVEAEKPGVRVALRELQRSQLLRELGWSARHGDLEHRRLTLRRHGLGDVRELPAGQGSSGADAPVRFEARDQGGQLIQPAFADGTEVRRRRVELVTDLDRGHDRYLGSVRRVGPGPPTGRRRSAGFLVAS